MIAACLRRLSEDELSERVTADALLELERLFGSARDAGCAMAVPASTPLEDPDTVAASLVALVGDLLARVQG